MKPPIGGNINGLLYSHNINNKAGHLPCQSGGISITRSR
jgi:hypothetical protein